MVETYPRVTGNPVVYRDDPKTEASLSDYRETGDVDRLCDNARRQTALYTGGAPLHPTVEMFAKRSRQEGMPSRDATTAEPVKRRQRLARGQLVLRVSDLEDFLHEKRRTKLGDQTPFLLSGGRALATHELLARYEALLEQCPSAETESSAQKTWRESVETDVERLRLVATKPGQNLFPDGDDHGSPYAPQPVSLL